MYENGSKGKLIFIVAAALAIAFFVWKGGRTRAIAGIPDPVQTDIEDKMIDTVFDGYNLHINCRYSYDIEGLAVSVHSYNGGSLGDNLARRDVALAWGQVAAYNKAVDFKWRQSGRWYFYKYPDSSYMEKLGGPQGISEHSSNNHLVATDTSVRKKIKKIRKGDHIRIKGYLVDITAENDKGYHFNWGSSYTRSDTGDHSCEVIYVTDVMWLD